MSEAYHLRAADARDAEAIAVLHTDSWQRTYRGMMSDEFLDGGALENRRHVWRERLAVHDEEKLVVVADTGDCIAGFICVFAHAGMKGGAPTSTTSTWRTTGTGAASGRR